jgi:hypothetical protein
MEFLSDRYDLEIRIDERAFERSGRKRIAEAKTALRPPVCGVSLAAVLQMLLDQVDANLEIRKGSVWIVPSSRPQSLAERLRPGTKQLRKFMDEVVTFERAIPAGTPLSDVLDYLSNAWGITLYLDVRSCNAAGTKDIDSLRVQLAAPKNASRTAILQELLDQVGATYVLRDRIVLIVAKPTRMRGTNR